LVEGWPTAPWPAQERPYFSRLLEGWEPIWSALAEHRRVTAMDRRGRGSSGDTGLYALSKEFEDIAAVATRLAQEQDAPVDVFGHS
jgi:pimeloyl-ACP methyl ester carboxylesterase